MLNLINIIKVIYIWVNRPEASIFYKNKYFYCVGVKNGLIFYTNLLCATQRHFIMLVIV